MTPWAMPLMWRLGVVIPLLLAPAWAGADALTHQLLMQWRGAKPLPDDLVLIGVDEASLDPSLADFGPWPWPRSVQAELAAHPLRHGASQVVFNIVHSGLSVFGPEDDAGFVQQLLPWRERVVLSASFIRQQAFDHEQVQLRRPQAKQFPRVGLSSFVLNSFGVVEATPGREELERMLSGFPEPWPQPLANVAASTAVAPDDIGLDVLGPAGHIPIIPAWGVTDLPVDTWNGKTVIIGATAPSLGDQLETPFGQLSGSEVLYAAIAGELQGHGFRRAQPILWISLALIWGGLLLWRISVGRTAASTTTASLLFMGLGAGVTVLGWVSGLWLPATALCLSPLLGGGLRATAQFHQENRQRRFLHTVLSRRVSPTLMEDMVRSGEAVWTQLGGHRSHCVVLFTDLVGFTTRSSVMEPDTLFALMNRYFEAIAAPVLKEQGLLDKFIGDALMAEFGIPHNRGDREEALAAVRAALAMQTNLDNLNTTLKAEGLEPLAQGIGLHFGEVMAGNLGSSHRLEYTVIGAAVNVASRLEGLTRRFKEHPILISGELRELLGDAVNVVDLGPQMVKGWPKPVQVFGLEGLNAIQSKAPRLDGPGPMEQRG